MGTENREGARRHDGGLDARVLGRLLHAMPVLEVLPTAERIAEFLTAALADVPGVKSCAVRLGAAAAQGDAPSGPGRWAVPVETGGQIYGAVTLETDDEQALRPYLPFVVNLAGQVALLTENRMGRERLEGALAELGESEERLSDFAHSAADWLWELDEHGVYTYSSRRDADSFVPPRGDVIGKTPFDFMSPEEAERVAPLFAEIMARKAPIVDLENWNIGADGERVCLLTNGVPLLDAAGNLKGYRGADKDITERKRAAEERARLAAIVDSAGDAILTKTLDGTIVTWNGGAERMYGYAADEIIGQSVSRLMPPESGEQLEALLDHVRRGEPVEHYEAVRVRRDGTRIDVSLSLAPVRDPAGVVIGASAIARDVTRRTRAEQEVRLLNAELELRVLTRTAQRDVAERSAHAGSFRWVIGSSESTWSPEFGALFDVEPGEFDGDLDGAFAARIHPDDLGELRRSLAGGEPLGVLPPHDFRIVRRDGDERIMRGGGTVERDAAGKATVLFGYVEDVTERLRAEAALRASEARYRGLVEGMPEGLAYCRVVFGGEGRAIDLVTLAVNPAFARVTGLLDAVGKPISEVLPHAAEQIPEFFAALGRVARGGTPEELDVDFVPLAQVQHVSAYSPAPEHVVAIFTDVTERRRSEEMNARLAAIVGSSDDAIFSKTLEGTILTWNAGAERMYGYAAHEIIGQSVSRLMPPGFEGELAALLARVSRGNVVRRHDAARLRKDGSALRVSLSVSPLMDRAGVIVGASVIEHDVTEQLRAEETLAESARRHRAILQTTMDGFWLGDGQGRLIEVNEAYCRMSGFSSEELVGMRISDLESAETAEEMKSHMETLIATGEDRFETRHRRKDGSVYDVAISVQYRPGEGGQFVAFLQDISERKAAEGELAQSALELRERLFDTVKAMGALVGVRDPYTATHEQRVTELAAAFAVEMGLDEGRREGLVLASQIHDIGKVAVPAEILSKPGALSAFEFALVRQHAEIGREILATISFRQPVATIVAQHHERLDGSGYPDGLKGDETMLEARILAVADVVEAMASHRPYRAALPLEEALAEIEAGAGTRYDADTCAAALRLFRERRFTFAA